MKKNIFRPERGPGIVGEPREGQWDGKGRDGDPNLKIKKGRDGMGIEIEGTLGDAGTLASRRPEKFFFQKSPFFVIAS